MKERRIVRRLTIALCVTVAFSSLTGYAEDYSCKIIEYSAPKDMYFIDINGKNYIAASDAEWKELIALKSELAIANERIQIRDKQIAALEKPIEKFDELLKAKNEYIRGLEEQITLYEQLVEKYKKLKSDSWLRLELAGGFTGSFNLAVLGGISVFNVSILGFIQNGTPGCFVGLNIPIL